MLQKLALGFLALSVAAPLYPVATDGASLLTTEACALPGVSAPARCGVLETLEVPDHPEGRRLSIHFAILPALSPQRLNDPLVLMMGGPGEDAISDAADAALELGLLLSITCSEDVPFVREQDVPAASDQTFLGSYRLQQQQGACAVWPKRAMPLDYREPVRSSTPTLFVTADRDGDTPLWFTDHVAAGFSRRAIVVVHGQGHTGWNDCVARLHRELVLSGKSEQLQTACPPVAMPPFAR
jgi:hypothetical protein